MSVAAPITDTALPFTWRVHLAARQPAKAAAAVLFIAATVALAYLGFRNWVFCVAAALMLVGSIGDFLFPVSYRLDGEGAHAHWLSGAVSLKWSRVRRCYQDPEGVKLSSSVRNYDNVLGVATGRRLLV